MEGSSGAGGVLQSTLKEAANTASQSNQQLSDFEALQQQLLRSTGQSVGGVESNHAKWQRFEHIVECRRALGWLAGTRIDSVADSERHHESVWRWVLPIDGFECIRNAFISEC